MFKIKIPYLRQLTFVILLASICYSTSAQSKEHIFSEGINLFQQADSLYSENADSANIIYQKAVNRFEYLIQKKEIKNGWVYYNLGNTYLRMKKTGLAIYNYEMAELYLPNNKDVMHNLVFAKSIVTDVTDNNNISQYHAFLDYIKYLPSLLKALLFIPLYIFVLLLFLTPLKRRFLSFYKWAALTLLIPILILIGLSSLKMQQGVIVKDNIIAKKGNSLVYENAFMSNLNQGSIFTLLERRDKWLKIKLHDGKIAWIKDNDARIIETD